MCCLERMHQALYQHIFPVPSVFRLKMQWFWKILCFTPLCSRALRSSQFGLWNTLCFWSPSNLLRILHVQSCASGLLGDKALLMCSGVSCVSMSMAAVTRGNASGFLVLDSPAGRSRFSWEIRCTQGFI